MACNSSSGNAAYLCLILATAAERRGFTLSDATIQSRMASGASRRPTPSSGLRGLLAILLALVFAGSQNPAATASPVAAHAEPSPLAESGRAVYQEQGCASCHAIAGAGNPRFPLDGVGDRLDAAALRDWILATGTAAELLPRRAAVMKEDCRHLGADEIDALVAYLSGLRPSDAATFPVR